MNMFAVHARSMLWAGISVGGAAMLAYAATTMTAAGVVSLLCLIVTGSLASWAVFSRHYDDGLTQRVGLSIIAIGTFARAVERITSDVPDPPPILLASQIGLALYAAGTALKIFQAHRRVERRRTRARRGLHA